MSKLPSQDLLHRCLQHQRGAWDEFLRRYSNLIYSTILKVGLPPIDQEEAFQSSVMALYRQLPRLREPDKLVSLIVGISYRQAVNRIRSRQRETLVEEVTDQMLRRSREDPTDGEFPDEERLRLEGAQQAREALNLLPDRCRRLLEQLFYEDPAPDYIKIARREKMPIGSIGPTRARCLEKLRRLFEDRYWVS